VAHTCNPSYSEAEIRRIEVGSQPRQIVCETLSRKNLSQNRAGGVAQGVGPEFKPQYYKKKKKDGKDEQAGTSKNKMNKVKR
jgi:acyl-CoA synthetase (AMP-forming)/AMP-acid ligase II